MNDSGYIYVLINYSMENLVKIGKTTRNPEERARELSSSTGVPMPFIVAYDAEFHDCTEAENYIHKKLGEQGYRLLSNREFFQVPLKEVIKVISEAQKVLMSDQHQAILEEETQDNESVLENESNQPTDIESLAVYHYESKNYREAYRLFKEAIEAGSTKSYYWLGRMSMYGLGCLEDKEEAEYYLKKGVDSDDVSCFGALSLLFKYENFDACNQWFDKYIKHPKFLESDMVRLYVVEYFVFLAWREDFNLKEYGYQTEKHQETIQKYAKQLLPIKDELLNYIIAVQDDLKSNDEETRNHYLSVGKAIKKI